MADNGTRSGRPTPAARKEGVALALAGGCTVRVAAAQAEVGERTVHSWLKLDPAFRTRVQELRSELFDRALGRLHDMADEAATVLRALLSAPAADTRLRAAKAVLTLAPRLRSVTEIEARLAALEAATQRRT